MKATDWKDRLGVVYSTNPDFNYETEDTEEPDTLDKKAQKLRVKIDKKMRAGKTVTLVTGFIGKEDDLKDLGKTLRTKCSTGGSTKDGEIIIQGDVKAKVVSLLLDLGYSQTKGV